MGIYRTARPPLDAEAESLACTALDSLLDDRGHAIGGWLAVFLAGGTFAVVRRGATVCGGERVGAGCPGWRCCVQAPEEIKPPSAALSAGTALLVESIASR